MVELMMTVVLSIESCEQVSLQVPANNEYSSKDIHMVIPHKCCKCITCVEQK